MKSLLIAIKPKWCAAIMNSDKTIEVRKNKALANAIQKLIDENGYADIYVYCSKNGVDINGMPTELVDYRGCAIYNRFQLMPKGSKATSDDEQPRLNGKVVLKFRCYKVEEIEDVYSQENEFGGLCESYGTKTLKTNSLLNKAQLDYLELAAYLNDYIPFGYAIHISDLEIFDKPKELREFKHYKKFVSYDYTYTRKYVEWELRPLTKAPQNFCYVEVD